VDRREYLFLPYSEHKSPETEARVKGEARVEVLIDSIDSVGEGSQDFIHLDGKGHKCCPSLVIFVQ